MIRVKHLNHTDFKSIRSIANTLCIALFLTVISSSIAFAITLSSPDPIFVDEPGGATTTTNGTLLDIPNNTVVTPAGDVFDYLTGTYTPNGGGPILPNNPGGATRVGPTTTAPDGTVSIDLGGGVFRVVTPDGTNYTTSGTVVTTPTSFTIDYAAVTVTNQVGTVLPTTTSGPVAITQTVTANPALVGSFLYLSAVQANGIFTSFDDPLDPLDNTATNIDDMPPEVQAWRASINAGFPIIVTSNAAAAAALASQVPEWAPYIFFDFDTFCNVQANFPPICGGGAGLPPPTTVTPPPANTNAVIDTSGVSSGLQLTADTLGLVFAQLFQGGEQAVNNWNSIWSNELLPDMQNLTAQWNTALIDSSRNYGTNRDMQAIVETKMDQEIAEYEALENEPAETTCQVFTSGPALGAGGHIGRAITRAYGGASVDVGTNAAQSPTEQGPIGDQRARWILYARHTCNPLSNGNDAGCEFASIPPTAPSNESPYQYLLGGAASQPYRKIIDGDVSVENFLLQDTIDQTDEETKLASYAIFRNLVAPTVSTPLPKTAIEQNPEAQAEFFKRREQQALRDIPTAVVGGIIGRRAPILDLSGVSNFLRSLRLRAGVNILETTNIPSYNEVMLQLSKERYYDPEFFLRINNMEDSELRQEQFAVETLIGVVQRDIYVLQEQMNGLLAARASVKFNREDVGADAEDSF